MKYHNLLVTGSLNAKKDDRTLSRQELYPVQIISNGKIVPLEFFKSWGELGVSAIAWEKLEPHIWYLTTGNDLYKIDLEKTTIIKLLCHSLVDVHEINIIDGLLWLSNTGADECVCVSLPNGVVTRRIKLDKILNSSLNILEDESSLGDEVEVVDRFHCNQIINGFDKKLYALVHHWDGKQFIRRVAAKLLKSQGNGGVIDLESGKGINLNLKAPHSIRLVGKNYWIFDSGRNEIGVYNKEWEEVDRLSTRGWGRGAEYDDSNNVFFAGISATRKRYLGLFKTEDIVANNTIDVIDVETHDIINSIELGSIEQVNNVYILSENQVKLLINLERLFLDGKLSDFNAI